jgi:hypothetical protein
LATTLPFISVGDVFSSSSQPGMHCLRISGSLSASHTLSRDAAMRYSPVMSMLIDPYAGAALRPPIMSLPSLRRIDMFRGI